MVQEIRAGQTPNPEYGRVGKQRSVHNTYFTLPVLFVMISNHYPMTYSHEYGWVVLALIMTAGVLIRQFFVLRHLHQFKWWLPVVAIALLSAVIVWLKPQAPGVETLSTKVEFSKVRAIIDARCITCHAEQPTQPGFVQPPKGIVLKQNLQISQHAPMIAQTVGNQYMPIGNLTRMTVEERQLIASWFAQGANVDQN